jgi:hypothetical protein
MEGNAKQGTTTRAQHHKLSGVLNHLDEPC